METANGQLMSLASWLDLPIRARAFSPRDVTFIPTVLGHCDDVMNPAMEITPHGNEGCHESKANSTRSQRY